MVRYLLKRNFLIFSADSILIFFKDKILIQILIKCTPSIRINNKNNFFYIIMLKLLNKENGKIW